MTSINNELLAHERWPMTHGYGVLESKDNSNKQDPLIKPQSKRNSIRWTSVILKLIIVDQKAEHIVRLQKVSKEVLDIMSAKSVAAEMFQCEALTNDELETVQNSRTMYKANQALLSVLLKASREVYECFLEALQDTNQTHVFLQIVCSGFFLKLLFFPRLKAS